MSNHLPHQKNNRPNTQDRKVGASPTPSQSDRLRQRVQESVERVHRNPNGR
jgi:hypothetical protein